MKCPKCHADNPDTSRFCSNCAAQLTPGGQPPPEQIETLESPVYALSPGSFIAGKYRVMGEIGRGGMGIVYEAEDMTLGRRVAIKALPEAFTADPERLARFEREAKVLASLNNPHIATIYGLEESGGKRFLVMEMVEGETLAARISRGPLPLEQALEVSLQIAEGVEAAHEKGIVHRDLKPSNVKLTPDGKVKVLDFGLAKAYQEETAASDPSKSPTITGQMTETGIILGTAAYMSPEQAKGTPLDKRTDIWAFGCILYECLAGKRAFPGDSVTESIAAILKSEPDWDLLPADTPGNVRAVLRRCLQKDPKERLRDIGDARIELEGPTAYPSETVAAHRRFSILWLGACAAIMLIAGILIDRILIKHPKAALSPSAVTLTIKVEPGHRLFSAPMDRDMRPSRTAVAISHDGRFVVYSAIEENPDHQEMPRLFLRRMDQPEAKPITGTEGGRNLFLSPDDRWVGFWSQAKLKKVPVEGGVPIALCDAPVPFGASWGPDNSIVFASEWNAGLSRVSAEGGEPETLTRPDPKRDELSHRLPSWLPDGKAVLFTVMRHYWDTQPWVCLLRLDTREWHVLIQNAADARYVPTGHLVFLRQGTLMAVRFDLAKERVIGQAFPLLENVMQAFSENLGRNTGAGQFGISDTGSLVYAAGGIVPDPMNSLVWVDQKGMEQLVTDKPFAYFAPRLSPDGQRIAYATSGGKWQIWVYELKTGTNTPLTEEGMATFPVWAPDGKRLLFSWQKSLAGNLFWEPYDGSLPMERLTTGDYEQTAGSWSSDGKSVALVESPEYLNADIAVLNVRSGQVAPFLNSQFYEAYPEFSPDGRWIAYASNESNRREVYVRPFPGPGMKHPVSNDGGVEPLWARDGKRLFYRRQDQVWVADVQTDGGFATSKPRLLFEKPGYGSFGPVRDYDLSLDGQRFLMVKAEQRKPAPVTEMTLIQNWFEELKRPVPAGKK